MAKKRVHEIAKEKGIPSKEVLAILQKAGFDVKAAASSVDEDDIATAFDPKPKKAKKDDEGRRGRGDAEPKADGAEPKRGRQRPARPHGPRRREHARRAPPPAGAAAW